MSIQIKSIVLYSLEGEQRILSFEEGKLNVITGNSKTGKSALISIVDYCLGSRTCDVPSGVIRNSVKWYAIKLRDDSSEYFIARLAPERNKNSASSAYLEISSRITIPNATELSSTTSIDEVVTRLESIVGINLNVYEPPAGQTRNPLRTTFRHSLTFVFQPQDEIAQKKFLFHKQSNNFTAQAIKDTLPYFLGAVDNDYVQKKAELKRLRGELRKKESRLTRLESINETGLNESSALLSEARNVGLILEDIRPTSWDEAISILRESTNASVEEQLINYEQNLNQEELQRLNDERSILRHRLNLTQEELNAVLLLKSDENAFSTEMQEQASRLGSIQLFDFADEPCCPLCNQSVDQESSNVELIEAELTQVSEQLERVTRHTPGLDQLILEKRDEINNIKAQLQENRISLEAIRQSDEQIMHLKESAIQRAYVLGRINLFLETLPQIQDNSEIRIQIESLRRSIQQLEEELSDEAIQERLDSIMSVLSRYLTGYAERLDLEHSGNPFRLDIKKLQVIADTEREPVKLERMGSGANWVGCHVIVHLALHLWFTQHQRPVPRFLFFDQPSQVYFPKDQESETSFDELDDEDRAAVTRMFSLMQNIINELAPNFQIIMTEHAEITEDWYQESIVERWRDGTALIPNNWIES